MSNRDGFLCAVGALVLSIISMTEIYCCFSLPDEKGNFVNQVAHLSMFMSAIAAAAGALVLTVHGLSAPTPAPAPDDGGK